ncbi:MAG: hypothetical protein LBQ89_03280 [Treponema sp.]|jgi:hypothetical protein|nr:hypothetical protein [Treponema sp.]
MKNKQTNVGRFAAAKLQAKRRGLLAIAAIAAVIMFTMIACASSGGTPANTDSRSMANTDPKSITITGISGTDAPTGNVLVLVSPTTIGDDAVAAGIGTISGGSITVDLFTNNTDRPFTGSGSYYVCIWKNDTQSYWVTKGKKSITSASTTIPWANQWDKLM